VSGLHESLVASALALALATGCARKSTPKTEPSSPAVANVGDRVITEADFKARVTQEPPFSAARYTSLDKKKELLGRMIDDQLVLAEARRRGLDQDPEVRAAFDKLLVHRMTERYAEERAKSSAPADPEVRRYYDEHLADFVTPTRVRVSHLFLAAPEKDAKRAAATALAQRYAGEARAHEAQGKKQAFEQLASEHSEDPATKARGGDLGFRTKDELIQLWGEPFATSALAMQKVGEIGAVVTTDRGVHVVKLLGRHEGFTTNFEAAKGQIEQRLRAQARHDAAGALVSDLRQRTPAKIDEAALGRVTLPAPGAQELAGSAH